MSKESLKTSPFFSANIDFINEFCQNDGDFCDSPSWAPQKIATAEESSPIKTGKAERDIEIRLKNLVSAYKRFGHLAAKLDPIGLSAPQYVAEIDPKNHGLTPAEAASTIAKLNKIYCGSVGLEFEYINNQAEKDWLAQETESALPSFISKDEKVKILKEVIRTEKFEQFLHKRFPGAKRFSVEGGDAAMPSVEKMIDVAAKSGVNKIVIGMAHRGRLNTLTGIMGKPYHQIFSEFKGTPGMPEGITKSGDVKYHMGYASTREISQGDKVQKIDLSLAFNPSHLEAVNVIAAGRIRAKQDLGRNGMALLIHGDAAFAGQGSVAESLVMNGVSGYNTGGVMHLIINNQVGFTANPTDSRSTTYCSDLAKMIDAPIFHVNGDDVEAVVKVSDIAMRYRQAFKKDVVIDLICYRKYGHNEGDEPLYTQPVMYTKLKDHSTLEKIYSQKLVAENIISAAEHEKLVADFETHLSAEFDKSADFKPKEADWMKADWSKIEDGNDSLPKTAVTKKTLQNLIEKTLEIPATFNANPKIVKQLEARKEAVSSGKGIDWGCGEALAFASLLNEGFPVRITGQDSGRGTFSHRHSILHDAKNGERHNIFSNIGKYEVYDSVLSEYGVLGFEYGYSLSAPNSLTIWEAQFGDFANGAQIIFDQFIASSEVKWLRKSGLVMLLPHGYEGQGPEHSSARLERYLQACADNNLRVVNITNPANFFHALRRQIIGKDRKPLVVMSPKSLLRHKLATSTIEEFSDLNFRSVIGETSEINKARKVILCTGKVYYDLIEARKSDDVAIIRLEQLYPFPAEELKAELAKFKGAEIVWCQEEPRNMGAWKFVEELIEGIISRPKYVGRISSASPATGYGSYHAKEQKKLIDEALS
jgi:2-oxoglutarate dehydrogenase E1 component